MNIIKYILSVSLALLVLASSVGMYIIKDTCPPCGESETVAQLVVADYQTHCSTIHDGCCSNHEQTCCTTSDNQKHEHEQNKYFFQHNPEYFKTTHSVDLKQVTCFIVAVLFTSDYVSTLLYTPHSYTHSIIKYKKVAHTLAMLCTYII